jgi:catalase
MILFSDRGTPDGYHNMHGYSGHTFKFVREDGEWVYVQIHVRADRGYKVLSQGRLGDQKKTGDHLNTDS